jgi:hypothetical protein
MRKNLSAVLAAGLMLVMSGCQRNPTDRESAEERKLVSIRAITPKTIALNQGEKFRVYFKVFYDSDGMPLPGTSVDWSLVCQRMCQMDASLSASSTLSDAFGVASVEVDLGELTYSYYLIPSIKSHAVSRVDTLAIFISVPVE